MTSILAFTINFDREAFKIPFLEVSVYWYGILFALGFYLTSLFLNRLIVSNSNLPFEIAKKKASHLVESLAAYLICGIVIGARLFHIAFYAGFERLFDLGHLIRIRDGGLSSHGGITFLLLALFLFVRNNRAKLEELNLNPLRLTDFISISSMINAGFIRLGNFINQEILGRPTDSIFGMTFSRPMGDLILVKRHPVQLYEAFFYFSYFIVLNLVWSRFKNKIHPGVLTGLFFSVLFTFRFFIEPFKENLSIYDQSGYQMGQLLSLPFIIGGLIFAYFFQKKALSTKTFF